MEYLDEGYELFTEQVTNSLLVLQELISKQYLDYQSSGDESKLKHHRELVQAYELIKKSSVKVINVGVKKMFDEL